MKEDNTKENGERNMTEIKVNYAELLKTRSPSLEK